MTFREKLENAVQDGIGLCVGLDPVIERLPEKFKESKTPLLDFNIEIIDATAEYTAAYKPNLAFYEMYGAEGWHQLEETIKAIPKDRIVIADGKRGDIGNTAKAYAAALFDRLGADAATINPYLGCDSMVPFVQRYDKGVFVLAVTSNPGGADFQELTADGKQLYVHITEKIKNISDKHNVGIVVGATRPSLWPNLLDIAGDLPLLIPGVGEQGGEVEILKQILKNYPAPALVNASRSIIFASKDQDFKKAAKEAARKLSFQLK